MISTPFTLILKTSRSIKSITRPGKDKVGIGSDGGSNGGDDGGYDDEHSSRGSEWAHQGTDQLMWLGL